MQDRTSPGDLHDLSTMKFGVGQPVRRTEDPVLVRGQGRFTDDVSVSGQAYAVMVRSRHAHGTIRGIDTAAARPMPRSTSAPTIAVSWSRDPPQSHFA